MPNLSSLFGVVVVTVFAMSNAGERWVRDMPAGAVALHVPASASSPTNASFTVPESGRYNVFIAVPLPLVDDSMEGLVSELTQNLRPSIPPAPFRFEWSLLEHGRRLLEANATDGIVGIIETGPAGLGGYKRTSRGFILGVVDLSPGVEYTFNFVPLDGFASFARLQPSIVVAFTRGSDPSRLMKK